MYDGGSEESMTVLTSYTSSTYEVTGFYTRSETLSQSLPILFRYLEKSFPVPDVVQPTSVLQKGVGVRYRFGTRVESWPKRKNAGPEKIFLR